MKLSNMERSRLKLTVAGMVAIFLVFTVPVLIIFKAANQGVYEISAAWIFLGTAVTAFGGIIGYYVSRETQRPSLLTTYTNINSALEPDPNDVGESDPESIPL